MRDAVATGIANDDWAVPDNRERITERLRQSNDALHARTVKFVTPWQFFGNRRAFLSRIDASPGHKGLAHGSIAIEEDKIGVVAGRQQPLPMSETEGKGRV